VASESASHSYAGERMMKKLSKASSVIAAMMAGMLALASSTAKAVVIDFDSFAGGTIITNQIAEFTVVPDSGNVVILSGSGFEASPPNVLANQNVRFAINFTDVVNGLMFNFAAEDDDFSIDVTHIGGTTTVNIPFDGDKFDIDTADLSGFTNISSIYFDLSVVSAVVDGIAVDNITFDVGAIPAPAGTGLVGLLLGIGLLRRRAD
jgi:hypothetical protein